MDLARAEERRAAQMQRAVVRVQAAVRAWKVRVEAHKQGLFTARQATDGWRWRPEHTRPSLWRGACARHAEETLKLMALMPTSNAHSGRQGMHGLDVKT